jgi:hypothetical protein
VVEAVLKLLEAGRHAEDHLAVLDGDDPPRGEGAAVAEALDLVQHRDPGVARPEEIAVQRVDVAAVVDRPGRGHEGLPRHLAAEDALAVLVGRHAPEDVHLDRLEVEQLDEGVDGVLGHARNVAAGLATANFRARDR